MDEHHYDHTSIEKKWQEKWEADQLYRTPERPTGEKEYVLDMYPYPSGDGLHVGHVEGYTATDIYTRFQRMNGKSVLHPMGWDAFGLPAENYAIKTGIHPRETTEKSIDTFRQQIKSLGLSYDWEREIGTHTPEYYKWTQWFFLLLYKNNLAYRALANVNWCESCKTVLANEQVVDGHCERCKSEVVQKDLEQWFFKIRDYADRLIDDLETVDWPESTKINQINWIGRSEGALLRFPIAKKYKFVLLHGYSGSPEDNHQAWLRTELEKRGHEVVAPELPNTDAPTESEWVESALAATHYDEDTIIYGHSLGAVTALKVAERLDTKIAGLVLVGGFVDPEFGDRERPFATTFSWEFDSERIKERATFIKILHDETDQAVTEDQAKRLAQTCGAPITRVIAEKPHFMGEQEPTALREIVPSISVFTTRPDTLYGATYMVLAPEHQLVNQLKDSAENTDEVEAYIKQAQKKTELQRISDTKEKTGVELKGVKAINPGTKEEIPIYIADYVLAGYGTGAIMAVPAHDERDGAFAKAFTLPVREVVGAPKDAEKPYTGGGILINSGEFTGMNSEEAKRKITESVGGEVTTTYKLRDWLVSRQRYWGAPIPIVYDPDGNPHPIPEEHLPWELPTDVEFKPTGTSPLAESKEFIERTEKIFGAGWRPEVDTLDTFVCSSWYFFRFADPHNTEVFAEAEKIKEWLPVDLYMGGAEHTVLHLMYARFFTKVLQDTGYIDFGEPFLKLRHQGTVLAEDGRKMSKSLGNVVNPNDVVEQFGADTVRLFEMFMGPLEDAKPWNSDSIIGVRRFLDKVWRLREQVAEKSVEALEPTLHQTIKKVGDDTASLKFNTAISQFMICVNAAEKEGIGTEQFATLVCILAPYAPHLAEELWAGLGKSDSVHQAPWPEYDAEKLVAESVEIVVQVNGKTRASFAAAPDITDEEAKRAALELPQVQKWVGDSEPKRVVYVPGKLVNIVV